MGKSAFVTGGSRGIGRAIVRRLAAEGYAVGINYLRSREAAEALTAAGVACRLAPPHLVMQSAVTVALEAEEAAGHGGLVSAQELLPVYLRPPQAERLRKERMSDEK